MFSQRLQIEVELVRFLSPSVIYCNLSETKISLSFDVYSVSELLYKRICQSTKDTLLCYIKCLQTQQQQRILFHQCLSDACCLANGERQDIKYSIFLWIVSGTTKLWICPSHVITGAMCVTNGSQARTLPHNKQTSSPVLMSDYYT